MGLDPFYPAPRHRLAIDLHFEYADVLAPELDAARPVGERVGSFELDPAELGEIFDALTPAAAAAEARESDGDELALARDYLSKGLLARAGAEVRRAVAAGAEPLDAALLTGEILLREELDGEALERFDSALARLEGSEWSERQEAAWLGRARALLRLGRVDDALAAATALEAGSPGHAEALTIRGEALLRLGRTEESLACFRALVDAAPADPAAWRQLGDACVAAGDLDGAERALRRAVELDPEFVAARIGLGEALLAMDRVDEAADAFTAALTVLPGYAGALLALAGAEERRGRPEAAVALLVELLTADAYHLEALCRLGAALLSAGRPADARRALGRVLRFAPGHAEAERLLRAAVAAPTRRTA
jgi:tetratricopeptide (TPR) repeat protein